MGPRGPFLCLKIHVTGSSNEQFRHGHMPLSGHDVERRQKVMMSEKRIAGRCKVDLQTKEEGTVLHLAAQHEYAAVTKQPLLRAVTSPPPGLLWRY